ncbi:MAG: acyltransferase family protein [Jatrophihabitantaceae bacterium]
MRATLGYNRALDGLRALAVGAVITQHSGYLVNGFYGVTVFFVISGYLITALLLAEHERTGGIGIREFYRRRWARLMPALAFVIVVSLGWLLAVGVPIRSWIAGAFGAATYTTDFVEVTGAQPHISNYFEWSWSLAIEEQFYLLWPLIMVGLLALGRRLAPGRRAGTQLLLLASLGFVVLAWVDRAHMVATHASAQRANFSFDSHLDAIAIGAIIAILVAGRTFGPVTRAVAGLSGAVGVFVLWAMVRGQSVTDWLRSDFNAYGQLTLVCAVVVVAVVVAPRGPLGRVLAWAPLAHLGQLSYGLYLWNMLVRNVFEHYAGHKPAHAGWAHVAWLLALVAVAELSYRFVETPLRRRWAHRPDAAPSPPAEPRTAEVLTSV